MKFQTLAVVTAVAVALSGCATMIKSAKQYVAVVTGPVTGATCVLTNPRGSWTVETPGVAHVLRSKEDIEVTCTKEGYQAARMSFPSDFNGVTAGNLVLGGLVGMGVDAATGADSSYPHSFQITMQPLAPAQTQAPTATPAAKPSS